MSSIFNSNNQEPNKYSIYIDYQDTDAGGVVHHSSYIKFAERARSAMLRDLFNNNENMKDCLWVVRELQTHYLAPARLEDYLTIVTMVQKIHNFSIFFTQDCFVNNKLIVKMLIKLVSLNHDFTFKPINKEVKSLLSQYMSGRN